MIVAWIMIEEGVPIPASMGSAEVLPLGELELGQSAWIAAEDPNKRAHWRGFAERCAQAHSLATGRGYLVRSCRRGGGDNSRGVRIWCTSIPAEFRVPTQLSCEDHRSAAHDSCARTPD